MNSNITIFFYTVYGEAKSQYCTALALFKMVSVKKCEIKECGQEIAVMV